MAGCKSKVKFLPATFSWFALITSTTLFFVFPCQYLQNTYHYSITIVQGVITLFVITNFFLANFMNPGVIPKASPEEYDDDFRAPLYKNVDIKGVTVQMKWCVTCQFYRPPRCSHCSVCDTCIETFDHHCPWMNNCIGRRNYRHFFFFLIFLTIHMITIFIWCTLYILDHKDNLNERDAIISIVLMGIIVLLFFPIIGLTLLHIVLVARGRTTNEQVTGKFHNGFNPFSQGCIYNCCYILCGPQFPNHVHQKKTRASPKKRFSSLNPYIRYDNSKKNNLDEGSVLLFPNPSSINNQSDARCVNVYRDESSNFEKISSTIESSQSRDCEASPPSPHKDNISLMSSGVNPVSSPISKSNSNLYKVHDGSLSKIQIDGNPNPQSCKSIGLNSPHLVNNRYHIHSITMRKMENGMTETTFPVTNNDSLQCPTRQLLYQANNNSSKTFNNHYYSHYYTINQSTSPPKSTSISEISNKTYSPSKNSYDNGPQGGMVIYYSPDAGGYPKSDNEANSQKFASESELEKLQSNLDEKRDEGNVRQFMKRPMSFMKALEISNELTKHPKQSTKAEDGDVRQSQYEMNYEISV